MVALKVGELSFSLAKKPKGTVIALPRAKAKSRAQEFSRLEIPLDPARCATTGMDPSNTNSNVLIVLCGLVGSGKSTFATALQRKFPDIRRCNQDELGRREDVEREVCMVLSQGLSVCVDRTNFDPSQRRTWIDIARQHSGVEIWGITMDTPIDICRARLIERKDHPTLKTPEKATEVLSRFSYQFVPIDANEGFNRVYSLPPGEQRLDYTREELENVLAAIRATAYISSPDSLPLVSRSSQGHRGQGHFPSHGHGGRPGSHGWRSHHSGPSWGPNSQEPQRDFNSDNWRTQGPSSTNTQGEHGNRGRGRGWVRGRGQSNYNPGYPHRGGNGSYPRGNIPQGAWYQNPPQPLQSSDSNPVKSQRSDVPGDA
ncbi:hypothetical protein RSOLAG1IB_07660 [Rhizoctonia solani AG-1 IB]|uniref:AAA domain-containing protein n=1 Tax=Thanatephorus cucumeris (strain AG1-IB / isolate 7/3/14) TaxID=1108050 RepID=A0A0B7FH36_THACB|nr:hypothetical protein RSOLAG1IB_07660 [Rhizoctonia solani AG-1 IB]